MYYGGAPAGPAGTGKTETVKDLGCTLGIYVVVTNCSDEHKYRDMAKIFKGVSQSGLWGCFDEFNRISLPTLSVIAAQVESITMAKKQGLKRFMFPNTEEPIMLVPTCAYFITMNPGYAGRQELPENLKVLFRGVTMMTPDRQVIIKVKLASVGYKDCESLSKKFNILYKLCEEQLSKQRHYDFGLRNILSVLRTAGNSKRSEKIGTSEEMIMARTLRDMNLSKFVAQDIPLFLSLLRDIFPLQTNIPQKIYTEIEKKVKGLMAENNLEHVDAWFSKIIQLYETSLVRHGFMVVGTAGCGKTTIMETLTRSLTLLAEDGNPLGNVHKPIRMNPKAISTPQLYGIINPMSGEWVPGVFSEIWKKSNAKANKFISWIIMDGPVDAIWIENLNTVLDDNRILTLANNERIPMSDNTKMVFEVENLNNASPATVSRCGIIFVSDTDLFWRPLIRTWCRDRAQDKLQSSPDETAWCEEFTEKYIAKADLNLILNRDYHYVMSLPEVVRITQLLNLMTALLANDIEAQKTIDKATFEKLWVYCLTWSHGGLLE
jgi:dynein heavy chain